MRIKWLFWERKLLSNLDMQRYMEYQSLFFLLLSLFTLSLFLSPGPSAPSDLGCWCRSRCFGSSESSASRRFSLTSCLSPSPLCEWCPCLSLSPLWFRCLSSLCACKCCAVCPPSRSPWWEWALLLDILRIIFFSFLCPLVLLCADNIYCVSVITSSYNICLLLFVPVLCPFQGFFSLQMPLQVVR